MGERFCSQDCTECTLAGQKEDESEETVERR